MTNRPNQAEKGDTDDDDDDNTKTADHVVPLSNATIQQKTGERRDGGSGAVIADDKYSLIDNNGATNTPSSAARDSEHSNTFSSIQQEKQRILSTPSRVDRYKGTVSISSQEKNSIQTSPLQADGHNNNDVFSSLQQEKQRVLSESFEVDDKNRPTNDGSISTPTNNDGAISGTVPGAWSIRPPVVNSGDRNDAGTTQLPVIVAQDDTSIANEVQVEEILISARAVDEDNRHGVSEVDHETQTNLIRQEIIREAAEAEVVTQDSTRRTFVMALALSIVALISALSVALATRSARRNDNLNIPATCPCYNESDLIQVMEMTNNKTKSCKNSLWNPSTFENAEKTIGICVGVDCPYPGRACTVLNLTSSWDTVAVNITEAEEFACLEHIQSVCPQVLDNDDGSSSQASEIEKLCPCSELINRIPQWARDRQCECTETNSLTNREFMVVECGRGNICVGDCLDGVGNLVCGGGDRSIRGDAYWEHISSVEGLACHELLSNRIESQELECQSISYTNNDDRSEEPKDGEEASLPTCPCFTRFELTDGAKSDEPGNIPCQNIEITDSMMSFKLGHLSTCSGVGCARATDNLATMCVVFDGKDVKLLKISEADNDVCRQEMNAVCT